jgi:hypothetical protein
MGSTASAAADPALSLLASASTLAPSVASATMGWTASAAADPLDLSVATSAAAQQGAMEVGGPSGFGSQGTIWVDPWADTQSEADLRRQNMHTEVQM